MRKQLLLTIIGVVMFAAAGLYYADTPIRNIWQTQAAQPNISAPKRDVGAIEGRVVKAAGEPIAGANVSAEREDISMGRVLSTRSDKDGNYRIEIEEPGIYSVSASKEEDGYPLTLSGFHRDDSISVPKVEVGRNQVINGIDVNIGSKASILEGVIKDATTNQPILQATITLRRANNPQILYRVGAGGEQNKDKFKVLVPHIPFTIEISSPGYETWRYSEDGSGTRLDSLRLNPGENRGLKVFMRRRQAQ